MEKIEEDMLSLLLLLFKSIEIIPCNSQKFFSKAIEPITNKIIHTIKQSSKRIVYPKPSLISPSFLKKKEVVLALISFLKDFFIYF